jgi:hypothetical protein
MPILLAWPRPPNVGVTGPDLASALGEPSGVSRDCNQGLLWTVSGVQLVVTATWHPTDAET